MFKWDAYNEVPCNISYKFETQITHSPKDNHHLALGRPVFLPKLAVESGHAKHESSEERDLAASAAFTMAVALGQGGMANWRIY